MNNEYPIVYIEWCDAMAYLDTWTSTDDAIEWSKSNEGMVKQVGYLISKDKDHILLASRIGFINTDEPELGGVFKIPTKWVKKIITIAS